LFPQLSKYHEKNPVLLARTDPVAGAPDRFVTQRSNFVVVAAAKIYIASVSEKLLERSMGPAVRFAASQDLL